MVLLLGQSLVYRVIGFPINLSPCSENLYCFGEGDIEAFVLAVMAIRDPSLRVLGNFSPRWCLVRLEALAEYYYHMERSIGAFVTEYSKDHKTNGGVTDKGVGIREVIVLGLLSILYGDAHATAWNSHFRTNGVTDFLYISCKLRHHIEHLLPP